MHQKRQYKTYTKAFKEEVVAFLFHIKSFILINLTLFSLDQIKG